MNDHTKQLIREAQEMGLASITIDGVKFEFSPTRKKFPNGDIDTKEVYQDLAALEDLTEEEILYWSTPYFDELQAIKELQNKEKQ